VAPKVWAKWAAKLDVIAALPGAIFATLVAGDPTEAERLLAMISEESAKPFADLKARLARDANARPHVGYAGRICTRATNNHGALRPHLHLVTVGIAPERLRALAESAGLHLAYAERVQNPEAVAKYIASRAQARHYDAVHGVRPFFARLPKTPGDAHPADAPQDAPQDADALEAPAPVSLGNTDPRATLEALAQHPPAGPIPIPGGTITDPALFIRATLAEFGHRSPTVRAAAESNALTFLRALHGGGP
jgi:hypothetical protein